MSKVVYIVHVNNLIHCVTRDYEKAIQVKRLRERELGRGGHIDTRVRLTEWELE